jgi:hypothetical protein
MNKIQSRRRRRVILLSVIALFVAFAMWHWNRTESKVGRLMDELRRVDEMASSKDRSTNLNRLVKAIVAVGPEAPFYVLKQLTNPPASWSAHVWLFNKAGALGIKIPGPLDSTRHQSSPAFAIQLMGTNAVALAPALGSIALSTNMDHGARGNALLCLGNMGRNGADELIAVLQSPNASEWWLSAARSFQPILRNSPELAEPVFQFYEKTPHTDWDTRRRYFLCLMHMRADPVRTTSLIREALSNPEDRMFTSAVTYAAEYFKPPSNPSFSPPWSEAELRIIPEAKRANVADLLKCCRTTDDNRKTLAALKALDEAAWKETLDELVKEARARLQKP